MLLFFNYGLFSCAAPIVTPSAESLEQIQQLSAVQSSSQQTQTKTESSPPATANNGKTEKQTTVPSKATTSATTTHTAATSATGHAKEDTAGDTSVTFDPAEFKRSVNTFIVTLDQYTSHSSTEQAREKRQYIGEQLQHVGNVLAGDSGSDSNDSDNVPTTIGDVNSGDRTQQRKLLQQIVEVAQQGLTLYDEHQRSLDGLLELQNILQTQMTVQQNALDAERALTAQISQNRSQIQEYYSSYKTIEKELEPLTLTDDTLAEIRQTKIATNNRLTATTDSILELNEKISVHDMNKDEAAAELKHIAGKLTDIPAKIAALETKIEQTQDETKEQERSLTTQKEKIVTARTTVEKLKKEVTEIETKQVKIQSLKHMLEERGKLVD